MKNKITCDLEKVRLDKYLSAQFPEMSRSQIQKLIQKENVKVNGKTVSVHHFLKKGDAIEYEFKKEKQTAKKIDFEIIFENDDFLIIDKPAGVIVHQFENIEENTLIDVLLKKYPQIKKVGDNPKRPGIVHRLDKDVSGLMVVAKNNRAYVHLKAQFSKQKVHKEYIALVNGRIEKQNGKIEFPIGRSTQKYKMAAYPKNEAEGKNAKAAISEFELINYYKSYSLLRVRIKTGRTHQIRVHLNALGFPVVGDKVYKNAKVKDKLKINRIFLHSYHLGFEGFAGERYDFYSYLPVCLKKILNGLNKNKVFVIVSGPSGVGKTSIISAFFKDHKNVFAKTTTYTTRPKRKGEVEEKNMIYVSENEFEDMVAKDVFLEWQKVHGLYYGTDKISFEKNIKKQNILTSIDVKGTRQILEKIPQAYTIFVNYGDISYLRKRLKERGDLTLEKIKVRERTALEEISWEYIYDFKIKNKENKLNETVQEFHAIIDKLNE